MKKMILQSVAFFFLLFSYNSLAQTTISTEDFNPLIGSWSGTLTYLNYSDGTSFSMPVDLKIVQKKETNNYSFYFSFPNEPQANSEETVSISEEGAMLNGESIISKRLFENGNIEIVTESIGTDDEKPATIRQTYIIGTNVFITKKDVLFDGAREWFNRNEFSFKKEMQEK